MIRHSTLVLALALTGLSAAPGVLPAQEPARSPHDSTWVLNHFQQAQGPLCQACHVRDFCASCHVNARAVAPIQNLPASPEVAAQMRRRRWSYPVPASHRAEGYIAAHASAARSNPSTCGTCHARESCLGCHRLEERLLPVAVLPPMTRGGARGVDLSELRPADHGLNWARQHRIAASGGDATCRGCHTQSFCASCHDGAASPGFHALDYVQRHAEDAYTRETECASCHQPQAFCVSCHRETGQARTLAPSNAYHDAQPMWVFAHGGAARRAIESCASCHEQRDCLKCHSAATGRRANPHGRGFDRDLEERNPALCRRCHVAGPPRS